MQRGRRKPEFTARRGFLIAAFMAPAALFVAVFTYYPMIAGSQMAFRNWKLTDLTDTSWVGLKNFRDVFADPAWGTVLGNTGIWVFGSIVPQLVIGFALALWLRRKFRFRGLYQALIFFPGRSPASSSASCSAGCSTASSASSTTCCRKPG